MQTLAAATTNNSFAETNVMGVSFPIRAGIRSEARASENGQLLFSDSGVTTVEARGRSWIIGPECALWIPPAATHFLTPTTSAIFSSILFPVRFNAKLPADCCLVRVNSLLRELILRMAATSWPSEPTERKLCMIDLMLHEIKTWTAPPLHLPIPVDPRLLRICSELLNNPADVRTLEEWSKIAGASGRTISRLFLKQTGLSFAHWRRQARLLAALAFLGKGRSVTTIALDVGYESTSAFIEMFKKRFGHTPGQYLC